MKCLLKLIPLVYFLATRKLKIMYVVHIWGMHYISNWHCFSRLFSLMSLLLAYPLYLCKLWLSCFQHWFFSTRIMVLHFLHLWIFPCCISLITLCPWCCTHSTLFASAKPETPLRLAVKSCLLPYIPEKCSTFIACKGIQDTICWLL